ncbi:hypothetical protein O9992_28810 [Vibrio lentus]|nr:hypothetical protein [Vibrio lentus]
MYVMLNWFWYLWAGIFSVMPAFLGCRYSLIYTVYLTDTGYLP